MPPSGMAMKSESGTRGKKRVSIAVRMRNCGNAIANSHAGTTALSRSIQPREP